MSKLNHLRSERGQALIQFTLMFLGLLAFVALAIEAGNLYSVRRQMQNAADAGALAAARELCLGRSEQTATDKAVDYLRRNGLSNDDVTISDVDITDNRVTVTARSVAETVLARVLNWNEITVDANARAACGSANAACGLWPVALDFALFEGVQCGQSLVIWDANFNQVNATCTIGGVTRDICDCYDCDLDDDGSNDFAVITDLARGWMDFPETEESSVYPDPCKATGCGASELACRIRSDYGGRVELPACIPGLRGVRASARDDVNSRAGETVSVPLFTSINCASNSNCTGTEAESYYVTHYGCVTVTGWVQSFRLNPKPGMPRTIRSITSMAVLATKDCSGNCMTFCGSTNGEPAAPWELRAASLIP
jgi:Flp pilus assembly protein TadG